MEGIVTTEGVLGGEPRLAGRRISVRQIAELVIDGANPLADIADQLDIPISEVHVALAYYENPEEIAKVQKQHRRAAERAKEQALEPPETATK